MLRTILFGPRSLDNRKPSKSTVAYLWGVKSVTPGSIAFVAVLVSRLYYLLYYLFLKCSLKAIFLHSVDHNFSNVGHKSRIPYGKLFTQYKQIITSGLIEQHPKWIELIRWYNTQVFAWQDMNLKIPDDDGSSGVDEALKLGDDGGWDEISFVGDAGGGGSNSAVQVSRITC